MQGTKMSSCAWVHFISVLPLPFLTKFSLQIFSGVNNRLLEMDVGESNDDVISGLLHPEEAEIAFLLVAVCRKPHSTSKLLHLDEKCELIVNGKSLTANRT